MLDKKQSIKQEESKTENNDNCISYKQETEKFYQIDEVNKFREEAFTEGLLKGYDIGYQRGQEHGSQRGLDLYLIQNRGTDGFDSSDK